MKSILISDFKGVNLQNGQWQNNFARYAKGVDFYGLNDNPDKISYPGVLQGAISSVEMAPAASPSAITEEIQNITYWDTQTKHYAIGRVNPARIYRLDDNAGTDTWYWMSSINTSGNGNNILPYSGYLYYATNNYVGRYDGTSGNANWQGLTDTLTSPRPMVIFSGSLYIGVGRYVAKYDGTTWTEQKLTLPSGFVVRSIEVYNDRIYISADNRSRARVYVWDGVSVTFDDAFDVADENYGVSLKASNGILWAITNRGTTIIMNQVYALSDGILSPVALLPIQRTNTFAPPSGIDSYQNGILIGSSNNSIANYEDGVAGLWYVGKSQDGNYYSSLLFDNAGGVTGRTINAVFTGGGTSPNSARLPILFSFTPTTGSNTILTLNTGTNYTNQNGIWQSLPIDAGDSTIDKVFHSIELNCEDDVDTTNTVVIKYRLDYSTTWTTLKTFSSSGHINKTIPLRTKGRVIEIRIEINSSNSRGTRVHAIKLNYTDTQ